MKPKTVEDAVSTLYGWMQNDYKSIDAVLVDEAILLYITINNEFLTLDNEELMNDCIRVNPNLPNISGPIGENAGGLIKNALRKRLLENLPQKRILSAYIRRAVEDFKRGRWHIEHNRNTSPQEQVMYAMKMLCGISSSIGEKSTTVLFNWILSWRNDR